ncbi:hypothetical protein Mapa_003875 [Marchantia paleacea]|nr:hypothetical protein Mapa_003875 [Marchantia paleacea]
MGHDNVPSISPAKWRTTNPQSPFWKSGGHARDESFDKPDLGWKALLKRHKFLLFMLAILTFLCTIYLYFAITFATVDACSTLKGKLRAHCYQLQGKDGRVRAHHGRRALLLRAFEISPDDLTQEVLLDECGRQYENYFPCRNVSVLRGSCRQRNERPPLCRVPAPLGYQRPAVWQRSNEDTSSGWERTSTPGFTFEKVQGEDSSQQSLLKVRGYAESLVLSGDHVHRVLTIGCEGCKMLPSGFMPKRDVSSLSILGVRSSGICIQQILDEGFPALLTTLFDTNGLPANAFDMIRSDGCGDQLDRRGGYYFFEVDRLLRPGGLYLWIQVGSDYEERIEELYVMEKLNWTSLARFEDFSVWKKAEDKNSDINFEVNGLVGQASGMIKPASKFLHSQTLAEVEALSTLGLDPKSQTLYGPSTDIWRSRVAQYIELLGESLVRQVRNVLELNAELGSFAAVLMQHHPVWVMNVVPTTYPEMLESIYNRGLLGIQHDWSQAFPTTPRSYDLVHSSRAFSTSKGVKVIDLILEVDRILRPGGLVIVRDSVKTARKVKSLSGSVRWRVLFEYPGDIETAEYVIIMKKESDAR